MASGWDGARHQPGPLTLGAASALHGAAAPFRDGPRQALPDIWTESVTTRFLVSALIFLAGYITQLDVGRAGAPSHPI